MASFAGEKIFVNSYAKDESKFSVLVAKSRLQKFLTTFELLYTNPNIDYNKFVKCFVNANLVMWTFFILMMFTKFPYYDKGALTKKKNLII